MELKPDTASSARASPCRQTALRKETMRRLRNTQKKRGMVQKELSRKLGVDVWADSLTCTMAAADVFLSGETMGQNILFVKYGPKIDAGLSVPDLLSAGIPVETGFPGSLFD